MTNTHEKSYTSVKAQPEENEHHSCLTKQILIFIGAKHVQEKYIHCKDRQHPSCAPRDSSSVRTESSHATILISLMFLCDFSQDLCTLSTNDPLLQIPIQIVCRLLDLHSFFLFRSRPGLEQVLILLSPKCVLHASSSSILSSFLLLLLILLLFLLHRLLFLFFFMYTNHSSIAAPACL